MSSPGGAVKKEMQFRSLTCAAGGPGVSVCQRLVGWVPEAVMKCGGITGE
jgi:hypothetical protein